MLASPNLLVKWKAAANSNPNKQNAGLPVAHGTSTDGTGSDSDSNSIQSSEPCVEPEDTELEDCQWGDDLGLAALDEEINRLLRLEEMEEPDMLASTREGPRLGDSENNGNHIESASGTSTSAWYKGRYPLCRRPPLCIQATKTTTCGMAGIH